MKTSEKMSLEDLLYHEMTTILQDAAILAEALDRFRQHAHNPVLGEAFESIRRQVDQQVNKLAEYPVTPTKSPRQAVRGMLVEANERLAVLGDQNIVDAELIVSAQRILHYQMAGLGLAARLAHLVDREALAADLRGFLDTTRAADERLSHIATHQIHWRASWWTREHSTAWQRVKTAFRRDWDQTKSRFRSDEGPGQTAGDTLGQMAGTRPVPADAPLAGFEADEPAFRYGYCAAIHYHDRDWGPAVEDSLRSHYGGEYEPARGKIFAGWDYQRRHR
ncbi:MAG: ferritin-like domain-containing protein [Vulcanimicrobiota bacterium]